MKKRDFIKTGLVGALGIASLPSFAGRSFNLSTTTDGQFEMPDLPYRFENLEPHLDYTSLRIHYHDHHAKYLSELKTAMSAEDIRVKRARTLLKRASRYSDGIVSNAGGFINHKIYWKSITPNGGGLPVGRVARLIDRDFGSYRKFQKEFQQYASRQVGSGWTWLVVKDGRLKIVNTANNDNPLMDTLPESTQGHPVLCLDMWEHAYYMKYEDKRSNYIDTFWKLVNWDSANQRLRNSKQA